MSSNVYSVNSVCFYIQKSNPSILVLNATGLVSSAGWSAGSLVPHVYVQPPADGIQDFDFVGTPPSGNVAQVLLPFCGEGQMEMANWMQGARVHANTNSLEVDFSDSACAAQPLDMSCK
ncbi:MAG: hypothetical protein C0606_09330 [Hyphomicrobiales bacterium]|nr:MAG: hypothetical protein C0606_09330 [Hyphomicrobiales bacterium]